MKTLVVKKIHGKEYDGIYEGRRVFRFDRLAKDLLLYLSIPFLLMYIGITHLLGLVKKVE